MPVMLNSIKDKEAYFHANLGLVYKLIKHPRYLDSCVTSREDLAQEGMMAMWDAINSYDFNNKYKTKLSSYVCDVIHNRLHNYYMKRTNHYRNLPNNNISIHKEVYYGDDKVVKDRLMDLIFFEKQKINVIAQINDIKRLLQRLYKGKDILIMYDFAIENMLATEIYRKYKHNFIDWRYDKFTRYFNKLKNTLRNYYLKEGLNGCRKNI